MGRYHSGRSSEAPYISKPEGMPSGQVPESMPHATDSGGIAAARLAENV